MKNLNGLKLQETDINIDGCPIMMAAHEFEMSVESDHNEALEMHYGPTRMPKFIAMIDYQEMKNFRRLPAEPAHILCLAEMELRAR